ncbi:putative mitochondrial [Gossypium arboreum]|uniref:Putative mitochondrial n=1 Tax=Gossypium arboreum TaxID=29729 RepID=A0A0B0N5J9_GOSAR|nr:putative mitochondrial [Gossypium arboreum]
MSHEALVLLKGKRTDSLYILEGSTVTGEIGCSSPVTKSKSTRLERRQLGHRRKKGMMISLDRSSLLDAGFEKLGHRVRENQTWVSFDLVVYKSKARSLLVSKHRFDSINSLHSSR